MSFWDDLGSIVNIGSTAANMYYGYQNMQSSQQMYDTAEQATAQQLALAEADRALFDELYKPLESAKSTYALEDLNALRGLTTAQRDFNIERGLYDIEREQQFYRPLEESVVEKLAEGVDPQEYMDTATMDVQRAFDRSRSEREDQALRYGINPNSGNFERSIGDTSISQALGEAQARTQARRTAEDLDIAKKSQALNYARGIALPSQPTITGQQYLQSASSGISNVASGAGALGTQLGMNAADYFAGAQYSASQVADYWSKED